MKVFLEEKSNNLAVNIQLFSLINLLWVKKLRKWDSTSLYVLLIRSMKHFSLKNLEVYMENHYLGLIIINTLKIIRLPIWDSWVLRKNTQVNLRVNLKVKKKKDLIRYSELPLLNLFNGEVVSVDLLLTQCLWKWEIAKSQT